MTEETYSKQVLIVGAGIAGMQAALDIAGSGYQVVMVDRLPSIGGHMHQLSETFPTLGCAQCIMTPRTVDVGRHPNIRLHVYSEVEEIAGEMGDFRVRIRRKPAYVNWDLCTACGACTEKCPTSIPVAFDRHLEMARTMRSGKVRYEEGLFIGHKHYDKMGVQPLFPFGFGLSYTSFEWQNLKITPQGDDFIVEIDVTNVGPRAGSDVVQVYVEDKSPILPRPLRELKGFAKLHLGAGETGTARVVLSPRSFATFDTGSREWIARSGAFTVHAGHTATDLVLQETLHRTTEWRQKP